MIHDSSSDSDDMSLATKFYLLSNASNRRFSSHPINQRRQSLGEFHHLYNEVKRDSDKFHEYLRMSPDTFNYILNVLQLNLKPRAYENFHANPITAEEMLVVTIR